MGKRGFIFSPGGFNSVIEELSKKYLIYAPVLKVGEGRFTDTDVVRYDFVNEVADIELEKKSDYSFKEILTPLSQTLFFFTENDVKEANIDERETLVFLRSCDLNALKRLDQIYLKNGREEDYFYARIRDKVKFVLMGCEHSYEDCFCVDMGTNRADNLDFSFSVDYIDNKFKCLLKDENLSLVFANNALKEEEVIPGFVTENDTKVKLPKDVPLSIFTSDMWDEYTARCIGCGRCNYVCPTCTCYTMQDVYYTDNGKVGERRRVNASCMVDGYTNVAGGGEYRKKHGDRMRFKTMHKIYDFRKRFGYNMCVGCGRCDTVCPEYISFSNIINKVTAEIAKTDELKEVQSEN